MIMIPNRGLPWEIAAMWDPFILWWAANPHPSPTGTATDVRLDTHIHTPNTHLFITSVKSRFQIMLAFQSCSHALKSFDCSKWRMPTHTDKPDPTLRTLPFCHTHTEVLVQLMWHTFQAHIQIHRRHVFTHLPLYRCKRIHSYMRGIHLCMCNPTRVFNINKYHLSSSSPFHRASVCCLPLLPSLCTSFLLLHDSLPLPPSLHASLCVSLLCVISPVLIPAFQQPTGTL